MKHLKEKIEEAISESSFDAFLAVGVDNFTYLTRTVLPFAEYYPTRKAGVLIQKNGSSTIILPHDWSQAILDQGWEDEIIVYDENTGYEIESFVKAMTKLIKDKELEKKNIGLDKSRITKGLYDSLSSKLPDVNWKSMDSIIAELRLIKTEEEISYIEKACKHYDRGVVYALMHLEGTVENPGYTISEFTERVRVHTNENGGSGVGILNSAFGEEGQHYYTPQLGWVQKNQLFRIDQSNHYKGWWTNQARMGVTGKPSPEQVQAYSNNLLLRDTAIKKIKPGVKCNDVFKHVEETAERNGIEFWKETGIGHGVGTSHHEAPYLNESNDMELRKGMVVALDIYTYGPLGELVHNKDIYVIDCKGNRKLSWYRSWDDLYPVFGFRTTH